ncbi:MAG: GWxTD domain-containing protein [Calditrichia bacterium]
MSLFQKFLLITLLSLFVGFAVVSAGNTELKFNMDYGRFRYDSTSVYLEVYYTVFGKDIRYNSNGEGETSETLHFAVLNSRQDSVLAKEQIHVKFKKPANAEEAAAQGTMGMVKIILPAGKYVIQMSHAQDTLSSDVSVGAFQGDRIMMSDLELCSNIITSSKNTSDLFYKNTMEVIPHPSLIYGKGLPRLYYYIEMYNLKHPDVKPHDKISVETVVADADGNVRLRKEYSRDHSTESTVERGAFNVSRLETGLYTLIFAATDSSTNTAVYRRRNFYVQNPDVVIARAEQGPESYTQSEFRDMPEKMLDDMFAQARYIASNSEINVYKVLNTVESKRQFLFKFWKDQDKKRPGWQDEYYSRVDYANEHYSVGGTPGWQTDMGRVYVLYGEASRYERRPVGAGEKPYEVWYYNDIEGGVEFDFVDLTGFGDYKLVNSTKRDEITYPNWKDYIYKH